jgi:hypothetical protein
LTTEASSNKTDSSAATLTRPWTEPIPPDIGMGVKVYVVFYEPEVEGGYKHWAVCLEIDNEDGSDAEYLIIQANGSQGQFRLDMAFKKPEDSSKFIQKAPVFNLWKDAERRIVEIAGGLRIRNEEETYNCQDFVMDLLEAIAQEFLDENDEDDKELIDYYVMQRDKLLPRMDGLA